MYCRRIKFYLGKKLLCNFLMICNFYNRNNWNLLRNLRIGTFKKTKRYASNVWVGVVKFGCALLGHGTLKLAVPQ